MTQSTLRCLAHLVRLVYCSVVACTFTYTQSPLFLCAQQPTAPVIRPLANTQADTTRGAGVSAMSNDTATSEVWRNMRTSFALPLEDIGKKPGIFVGSLNLWCPIRAIVPRTIPNDPVNPSTQGPPPDNLLAFASVTYFPVGYWFVNASYFQFINRAVKQPWHPDFTYSFGYNDWHPYTFSLIYGNYGGNRFNPDVSKGERVTQFEQGTVSLGFKFPAPKFLRDIAEFHPTSILQHQVAVNTIPSFYSTQTVSYQGWQTFLTLQTRYNVISYFYALLTLFYYPVAGQQQPWSPDFTYGIGYADWHSFTLSVQYNNYAGNRFPWNKPTSESGQLFDGILSVSFNITL
jgi:hypothetical protein